MREQRLNGATVKFKIDDLETPPQVDSAPESASTGVLMMQQFSTQKLSFPEGRHVTPSRKQNPPKIQHSCGVLLIFSTPLCSTSNNFAYPDLSKNINQISGNLSG